MNSRPRVEHTPDAPAVDFRHVSLSFDGKAAPRAAGGQAVSSRAAASVAMLVRWLW